MANLHGVVMWNSLFIIPVGDGESLGNGLLAKNEIEERKIRFVGVIAGILVRDVRWGTTNTSELKVNQLKMR